MSRQTKNLNTQRRNQKKISFKTINLDLENKTNNKNKNNESTTGK